MLCCVVLRCGVVVVRVVVVLSIVDVARADTNTWTHLQAGAATH